MRRLLFAAVCAVGIAGIAVPEANAATCPPEKKRERSAGSRILGGVAGGLLGRGRLGWVGSLTGSTLNSVLIDSLACKLEPPERTQAADATRVAVQKPVGTTESWTSDTRPNVTGSSTVASQSRLSNGTVCKDVRDVATINGEETVVNKRMCRTAGSNGYVLQQPTQA